MGLNHQPVKIQVHRLLGYLLQKTPFTCNMTRIANHRQIRPQPLKFNRDLPVRGIPVAILGKT